MRAMYGAVHHLPTSGLQPVDATPIYRQWMKRFSGFSHGFFPYVLYSIYELSHDKNRLVPRLWAALEDVHGRTSGGWPPLVLAGRTPCRCTATGRHMAEQGRSPKGGCAPVSRAPLAIGATDRRGFL